jgi:hypothetical protein
MPKGRPARIDEKKLTKGELRKLNALRKSLGEDIAAKAFSQWYARQAASVATQDKNAGVIAEALWKLVKAKRVHIGRKGYVVKRGRGRLIVEARQK